MVMTSKIRASSVASPNNTLPIVRATRENMAGV